MTEKDLVVAATQGVARGVADSILEPFRALTEMFCARDCFRSSPADQFGRSPCGSRFFNRWEPGFHNGTEENLPIAPCSFE